MTPKKKVKRIKAKVVPVKAEVITAGQPCQEVAVHQPEPTAIDPSAMILAAIKSKVPVETMERILAMRTQLRAEAAKEAFDHAMAKFQQECPTIKKTKEVKDKQGRKRYSYAPIDSIVDQVKDTLGRNGLSYRIDIENDDKIMTVLCTVKHTLGHFEVTRFPVPIGSEEYMTDAQKYGARSTFAKRYAFMNALGIMTGDEDTDSVPTEYSPQKTSYQPKPAQATNQPNFLLQLKDKLYKLGAMNSAEAVALLGEIMESAGKQMPKIKSLDELTPEQARVMLSIVIINTNR